MTWTGLIKGGCGPCMEGLCDLFCGRFGLFALGAAIGTDPQGPWIIWFFSLLLIKQLQSIWGLFWTCLDCPIADLIHSSLLRPYLVDWDLIWSVKSFLGPDLKPDSLESTHLLLHQIIKANKLLKLNFLWISSCISHPTLNGFQFFIMNVMSSPTFILGHTWIACDMHCYYFVTFGTHRCAYWVSQVWVYVFLLDVLFSRQDSYHTSTSYVCMYALCLILMFWYVPVEWSCLIWVSLSQGQIDSFRAATLCMCMHACLSDADF